MFLSKQYVLANELVQKMGIHIANISMLMNGVDEYSLDFIKMNNCTFIKRNSHKLPNNIKVGLSKFEFTDVSNILPCTWVRNEYELSDKELMSSGVVKRKIKVAGKDFYEFTDEFVKKVGNKIGYTLNKEETMECFSRKQINGYVQMSKNKYLTWY